MNSAAIDLVLDVGAHVGTYGRDLRQYGYTGAIVSFEPRQAAFRRLSDRARHDPKWTVHNVALGGEEGLADINIAGNEASSSMLDMTGKHVDALPDSAYRGKEVVTVRRLDDVAHPRAEAMMLKLDVQGFEAEVLSGAAEAIERARLVECELCIPELYRGQPLMLDMMNLFAGLGFQLVALEPEFQDPRSGAILAFDGLFSRAP